MRLLYICNEYPPGPHGGIGTFVRSLARQLARCGHEVMVVGLDDSLTKQEWLADGAVQVLRLACPRLALPCLTLGRLRLHPAILSRRIFLSQQARLVAAEFQPDLVESYDWSGPLWFAPARPLVVRLHGAHTAHVVFEGKRAGVLFRYLERRNVSMADGVIAISRHIADTTLSALGLGDRSFEVIYNGVDPDQFHPVAMGKDPGEVLYVGSMHPRKGLQELFRVIPDVLSQVAGSRFTVVGRLPAGGRQSAFVKGLLSLIPDNLQGRVQLVGHVRHEELPHWYSRAALLVVPSRSEAFGLVCAEAMACETPVVMTSRGCGPEIVEHEETGLLADPADSQQLGAAIVRLLHDASLRRQLGEQARQCVLRKFPIAGLASRTLNFYGRVLDEHRGVKAPRKPPGRETLSAFQPQPAIRVVSGARGFEYVVEPNLWGIVAAGSTLTPVSTTSSFANWSGSPAAATSKRCTRSPSAKEKPPATPPTRCSRGTCAATYTATTASP